MDEVSGKNVTSLMNAWIKKKGFPCVSFSYNEKKNEIIAKQSQFQSVFTEESETIWPVPIKIEYTNEKGSKNVIETLRMTKENICDSFTSFSFRTPFFA